MKVEVRSTKRVTHRIVLRKQWEGSVRICSVDCDVLCVGGCVCVPCLFGEKKWKSGAVEARCPEKQVSAS